MKTNVILALLLLVSPTLRAADPAPFPGAHGDYGGVLTAAPTDDPENSGILIVGLSDSGAATLKLVWQGQTYALKAPFDGTTKQVDRKIPKKGVTDGTKLDLFCFLDPDSHMIGGVLNDPSAGGGPGVSQGFSLNGNGPDPTVAPNLPSGLRVGFVEPPTSAAPENGTPQQLAPSLDEDGFAVVSVSRTTRRSSRFVGRVPDGTPFSAGSPLRGKEYAVRAGLYAQRGGGSGGQVLGVGGVDNATGALSEAGASGTTRSVAGLIAALRWHKRAGLPGAKAYPGGLDTRFSLNSSAYTASRNFSFSLTGLQNAQKNATLNFRDGNLGTNFSVGLNVTIFGAKIVGPNPNRMRLSVAPVTGRFNGTFRHPDTAELVVFHGAFSSFVGVNPGEGRGNFLSKGPAPRNDPAAAHSGSVRMTVNP